MNMFFVLMIVAAAIVVSYCVVLYLKMSAKNNRVVESEELSLQYEAVGSLLTPAELSFFGVLRMAVDDDYYVMCKVRIGDVINVKKGVDRKQAFTLRNKIQQKHFDFVICRKDNLRVHCCVELNDRSHDTVSRSKRDEFVRAVCLASNIRLIEIKAQRSYKVDDIKSELLEVA